MLCHFSNSMRPSFLGSSVLLLVLTYSPGIIDDTHGQKLATVESVTKCSNIPNDGELWDILLTNKVLHSKRTQL